MLISTENTHIHLHACTEPIIVVLMSEEWLKDLNVRPDTRKLLEENTAEHSLT